MEKILLHNMAPYSTYRCNYNASKSYLGVQQRRCVVFDVRRRTGLQFNDAFAECLYQGTKISEFWLWFNNRCVWYDYYPCLYVHLHPGDG